jgi:hypothetical protein
MNQFLKRKSKEDQEVAPEPVVVETPLAETEPAYTQTGFDVFTRDGGKSYEVAEFAYDPVTMKAEVINLFSISRLIALSYGNQKVALQTLKKGKK